MNITHLSCLYNKCSDIMFLLFILIVTPKDPASAKYIAQSNVKPLQKQAHRSARSDSYFQERVKKAENLLEVLNTLPTTEPPDIFDNVPSFLTSPKSSNFYISPNEKIFIYSSSVKEEFPSLQFGSRVTYAITNVPKHTYSSHTTGKMANWPLDEGKGTWFTWVTMFPTTTYATKSTRRTLGPDPLTASMITQISTEETEYNPVKAWYEKQKTTPNYLYTDMTHNPMPERRRVKSSDLETPVTALVPGSTKRVEQDKNTNIIEKASKHPKILLGKDKKRSHMP